MDYRQQINEWFKTFDQRFDERVPFIVAETATTFFKERFKTQEWDNVPWQPLSPKYAASKSRGRGRILTASGAMQQSIRPSTVRPERVVISAGNQKVPYARIHNEGLRVTGIVKVREHNNRNFMGKGKAVKIRSHNRSIDYTMPQRQFMGHSRFLNERIIKALTDEFNTK